MRRASLKFAYGASPSCAAQKATNVRQEADKRKYPTLQAQRSRLYQCSAVQCSGAVYTLKYNKATNAARRVTYDAQRQDIVCRVAMGNIQVPFRYEAVTLFNTLETSIKIRIWRALRSHLPVGMLTVYVPWPVFSYATTAWPFNDITYHQLASLSSIFVISVTSALCWLFCWHL